MTEKKPPAPKGLSKRGGAFWRRSLADYELSGPELELLVEVCRALDECEALAAVVERDGTTTAGSRGQVVVHPALGELRQTRLMLGRLLAQLDMPDEAGAALPSSLQARGRQAASKRWAAQKGGRRGSLAG